MSEQILFDCSEGILTLQLNRPEKHNALTNSMYSALADALLVANHDDAVQVVIITGGESCFTSGNDLMDFLDTPPTNLEAPAFRFMASVIDLEKPLIAAVCGAAIGIGTTLLPHCDLVYITRQSKLGMPFVKLGLCQEFAASLLMPQILGPLRASELLLTGENFNGQSASDWGLANAMFEHADECLQAARLRARQLCNLPQTALRDAKRLLRTPQRCAVRDILRQENLSFISALQSDDARRALKALVSGAKSKA